METISAIATAMGEGGVGIVRLSGDEALAIAGRMFVPSGKSQEPQKNFTVRHGHIVSRDQGRETVLDEALLLVMRAPKSYTGEDVAELHAHGGPALLRTVWELTIRQGARAAQPGEFTKRAFLNGRLDLLQAEAVLDLIQAKTERGVRWAASQLGGCLSRKMEHLKHDLLEVLIPMEAAVDFPEDVPETDSFRRIEVKLTTISSELKDLLEGASLGLLAKRGLTVALWGRPNVGKSSLLNRLTLSDRVIVTPLPGTTRDVVEQETSIGGFPVRFQDTAGVQDTEHPVEKESIERSRRAALAADLVLLVLDSSRPLTPEDRKLWEELAGRPKIAVLNKSDLVQKITPAHLKDWEDLAGVVSCSCIQEGGEQVLRQEILRFMTEGRAQASEEPLISSVRQKEHLEKALDGVDRARQACSKQLSYEFVASDVRRALDHLGALVGEVVTDDVLELVFNKFCIGK